MNNSTPFFYINNGSVIAVKEKWKKVYILNEYVIVFMLLY